MTKEFKVLVYSNLMFWISKLNLKIGEFETKAGMTPGYLSKLQKDDSKSNNILDFIVNASKILGVSIDSLVSVDFTALTKTEKYFAEFIDKLIRDTNEGLLCWNKETTDQLNDYAFQSNHPLFRKVIPPYGEEYFEYDSHYDINVSITSECYNVEINNSTLYLMNVNSKNDPFGIELYFVQTDQYGNNKIVDICNISTLSPLEKLGGELNAAAKESSNHIKLDNNARTIIDDFMNDFPF